MNIENFRLIIGTELSDLVESAIEWQKNEPSSKSDIIKSVSSTLMKVLKDTRSMRETEQILDVYPQLGQLVGRLTSLYWILGDYNCCQALTNILFLFIFTKSTSREAIHSHNWAQRQLFAMRRSQRKPKAKIASKDALKVAAADNPLEEFYSSLLSACKEPSDDKIKHLISVVGAEIGLYKLVLFTVGQWLRKTDKDTKLTQFVEKFHKAAVHRSNNELNLCFILPSSLARSIQLLQTNPAELTSSALVSTFSDLSACLIDCSGYWMNLLSNIFFIWKIAMAAASIILPEKWSHPTLNIYFQFCQIPAIHRNWAASFVGKVKPTSKGSVYKEILKSMGSTFALRHVIVCMLISSPLSIVQSDFVKLQPANLLLERVAYTTEKLKSLSFVWPCERLLETRKSEWEEVKNALRNYQSEDKQELKGKNNLMET